MKEFIVQKFGGTSMGSASAMRKSMEVVKGHPQTRLVVVSATSGTTNLLLELINLAPQSQGSEQAQAKIEELHAQLDERHESLALDLGMDRDAFLEVRSLLNLARQYTQGMSLLGEASLRSTDSLLAIGEQLSSWIFFELLKNEGLPVQWLDVREIMITNSDFGRATPNRQKILELAENKICDGSEDTLFITQGFIGRNENGHTTTLGRGGSDYSAALLAEAIGARELQIWTDVPGLKTTDPRLVPQARTIDEINFNESAELANFGAKILHPATLWPAIRQNIPVYVGDSQNPELGGTWIRPQSTEGPLVRALALRKNQKLLTLSSLEMLQAPGFLAKIFDVLARHKISVDLVTTSEVHVAITLDVVTPITQEALVELKALSKVQLEESLALIAVIGNDLACSPGIVSEIFKCVENSSIRAICHGAGAHNLCFLVREDEATEIIQSLHDRFLGEQVEELSFS